ncbi:hypothetical protein WBP07_08215 [Novosphingobium sp. BL-8A]|uniref:hypothetical protein n=1 Tax=Novosphingobium sp. BL-8A TaxID=3127639 RepID=UPI00375753A8
MSDETIDLSKLSETELHILRLFAQGHTAKSVAAETERTVGAVNERLREARRKTGIASSRELARILAAQEYRDDKIDLDQRHEGHQGSIPANATKRWPLLAGVIFIMIALAGAVLAGTMLAQSAPNQMKGPEPVDPLIGKLASSMSPGEQYRLVRTEKRDEAWATPAERAIVEEYGKVLRDRGVQDTVRVRCATTVCEVALRATITFAQNKALTEDFQSKAFYDRFSAKGLAANSAGFSGDGAAFLYFSYWDKR